MTYDPLHDCVGCHKEVKTSKGCVLINTDDGVELWHTSCWEDDRDTPRGGHDDEL